MEDSRSVNSGRRDSSLDDLRRKRLAYFSQSREGDNMSSGIDQDRTGTQLNDRGTQLNDTGTQLNDRGTQLNDTGTQLNDTESGFNSQVNHMEERRTSEHANDILDGTGWKKDCSVDNDYVINTRSISCVNNKHAQGLEHLVSQDARNNELYRDLSSHTGTVPESPSQVNTSVWNSPKSAVVRSSFDVGELGLCTHRPESNKSVHLETKKKSFESPSYEPEVESVNQKSTGLEDTFCDAELRELLGEEKYQELIEKSRRDIEALKLERKASPGRINATNMVSNETTVTQPYMTKEFTDQDIENSRNAAPVSAVSPNRSSQHPLKLNRPKHVPAHVSNYIVKSRGDLDKELPQVHQDYGVKNYEQTSVPRNFSYSCNEIYKQAYNEIPYNPYLNYSLHGMYHGVPQTFSPRDLENLMRQGYPPPSYMNVANQQTMMYYPNPSSPVITHSPHSPMFTMNQPHFSPHPPGQASSRGQGMMAQPPAMFYQCTSPAYNMPHDRPVYPVPQPPREPPYRNGNVVTQPQVSQELPQSNGYYRQHQEAVLRSQNLYASQAENYNAHVKDGLTSWPRYAMTDTAIPHPPDTAIPHPPDTAMPHPPDTAIPHPPDTAIPHPPTTDKSSKRHPHREHIEGVRHFHENGRRIKAADSQELNNAEQYAVDRLEKYFSSIEGIYIPKENHKLPSTIAVPESDVHHIAERLASPMDEELETLVASTITNLKAGGVTERLKKLGIEIPFLNGTLIPGSGPSEDELKENATNEPKQAKICTECSAMNKSYMSWCANCGEVLIGVDTTVVRSNTEQSPVHAEGEDSGFDDRVSPSKPTVQFVDDHLTGSNRTRHRERVSRNHSADSREKGLKPDTVDSGRGPSSGEEREKVQHSGRTDKEIVDICQSIDDPIIRGFLRSYLRKRNVVSGVPSKTKKLTPSSSTGKKLTPSSSTGKKLTPSSSTGKKPTPSSSTGKKTNKSSGLQKVNVEKYIDNGEVWLHEVTPVYPQHNTPVENGSCDKTDIDLEVFDVEEGQSSRTVSRNGHDIPLLDLGFSSDDQVNEGKVLDLTLTDDDDDDDSVEVGQGDAPLPDHMLAKLQSDPRVVSVHNSHLPNASESQTAHTQGTDKKTTCTKQNRPSSGSGRKNTPTPSKSVVRASIEAKPPKRHWMRSSIAWSSYNPGELKNEQSLPPQGRRCVRRSRHPQVSQSLHQDGSSSGDSTEDLHLSTQTPLQKRPASADIYRRKAKLDVRPDSAGGGRRKGHWDGQRDINLKSRTMNMRQILGAPQSGQVSAVNVNTGVTEGDEEVQNFVPIPVTSKTGVLSPIPCPAGTPGHVTAQSAYDRYHSMTPRISDGSFSVWLCLPDELFLFILSHLSLADLARCTRVCKHFYRVSMDQSLWRSIVLTKRQDLSDETLEVIGQRQPISLSLIQCHGNTVTASGLQKLFQHCGSYLEELNISRCSRGALVGDSVLLQASVRCKQLTHVDMSWTYVTDNGLSAVSSTALGLESVCMNGCQSISNHGLETLLRKHGKSLRVLELFGCFNINQTGIRSIAHYCRNLLTLNLGQCYKLTDSSVTEVTGSLPRLESLDIRGCKQVRDNSVRRIVKNCPRLTSIALANCPHISDIALCEIATYLTRIKWIDLCGCKNITDDSLRALCKNCQNLQYLDISSTSCTKKSVYYLANNCNKRLEVAKLNFLTDIDEASVLRLVKNCPRLTTLHLYGCKGLQSLQNKLRKEKPNLAVEMG